MLDESGGYSTAASAGTPGIAPVVFDDELAGNAAWQLELTANAVMEAVQAFQGQLPGTTQDWSGAFRGSFDEEASAIVGVALDAAEQMLATASRIRALQLEADAANRLYQSSLLSTGTQP